MTDDDMLVFAPEDEEPEPPEAAGERPPWRLLVVDDEDDVHAVTRLVLGDLRFRDRRLEILAARSAAEARQLLADIPDIAAVLLDVVMETDHAGLDLTRWIRRDLGNALVRIILRTGQPGQAPERQVIVDYDINDYKEKAELTAAKLFTAVVAALRSYQDLVTIETSRRGLERIIDASGDLFRRRSMTSFLAGVLAQLNAILDLGGDALLCIRHPDKPDLQAPRIAAATGRFAPLVDGLLRQAAPPDIAEAVIAAFDRHQSCYLPGRHLIFFHGQSQHQTVIYIDHGRALSEIDLRLVDVFCGKAAVGLDNVYLQEQLRAAVEATVQVLAKVAEYKDDNTGAHVRRVSAYSTAIARILREEGRFPEILDDEFVSLIGLASVLHDVGKVGIPDGILKKPGRLAADEWAVMAQHPAISRDILAEGARKVDGRTYLSMGSEIAAAHHEHYDGTGYPNHLTGEQIPLAARILAVADVFDALTSRRPYKEPWPVEDAVALIAAQAGHQFDPVVAQAFLRAHSEGRLVTPAA